MALDHAILVSLTERAASGYDLARRFDASIGYFWPASHQQIYRVLARMQEAGWVESTVQEQDGRPDKKTYAITPAGEAELDRWSATPSGREAVRSDFAVKLRGFRDPDAILADTRARRADHVARLTEYEASEARFYPDPSALDGADLGAWLALRGGIHTERRGIEWCDDILTALEGPGSR
ncbi:PadR family transcriptional regulator [Aeromicrobium duanguangcaii]|uniref:PadR family transcriptional regulator n=1 Tax=Aeromicrobium duanguangcaii TaxID=2968086 RepID=UPI0020176905|nr:PadR family transcriptional regulator [Aeromicrobium duanguangcaii]MCL3838239.1 PadR family transcriptional regulator [Aeromicrobium duanguangcaii]